MIDAQGLRLALYSGNIPGDSGDDMGSQGMNQDSCMLGKSPTCCIIAPGQVNI